MVAIYERPRSSAGFLAQRLAVFAVALLAASILSHFLRIVPTPALFLLLAVVGGVAALALLLALVGLRKLWKRGATGGRASGVGLVLAVLVLVPFAYAGFMALRLPALTDVSTDLVLPPQFIDAPARRGGGMNELRAPTTEELEQQFRSYPQLAGRRYSLPLVNVYRQVEALTQEFGWPVTAVAGDPAVDPTVEIETEAPLGVLRLVSDVAIRLEEEDGATFVDMRAASRWGRHDLGANARAIERFLERLDEALLGLSAG